MGNGNSIRVWDDPWLPVPISFRVQSSNPRTIDQNLQVSDLICPIIRRWDGDKIKQLVSKQEAISICSIPLSWAARKDVRV